MSERKIESVEVIKDWPGGPEKGVKGTMLDEETILANPEFFKVTYEDEAPEKKKTRFVDVRVEPGEVCGGTYGLRVTPPGVKWTLSLTDIGPGWYDRKDSRSRVVGYKFEGSDMVMPNPVAWWRRCKGLEPWMLVVSKHMEDGYEYRPADLEFVQFEVEE